ncbi:DUF2141 domain-containing protein [Fulvivirgaceae bacterium PWU4]|uniref:DUF2141 domain-containing protein n=1 Tax=Chryseosolibacter histidini TaxID=2782349 RepID=A0AAP2DJ61_9BACT|nr:DUF2141 domain-containing protein [Chryseosolibacter histidini]MBT1696529.1 DUF2141 domain-containing protein [Chryseosolibacter histidini]
MKTKYVFFGIVCLLAASRAIAQSTLEVTVKNIREAKGSVRIALFTNEQDFLKKAAHAKVVDATGKEIKVVFEGLTPGVYGVSVFHDANGNGTLDKNLMGMPTEGFAFGNNAMGMFGPPSFEKAQVTVGPGASSHVIDLKYM